MIININKFIANIDIIIAFKIVVALTRTNLVDTTILNILTTTINTLATTIANI